MTTIDIRRVRLFLKFCETFNFSMAAREVNLSQPGLTKAIMALEAELGAPLIRREGRSSHLTPFGQAMLEHFRDLDRSAARTEDAAQRFVRGDMPVLRLGVMCTIGPGPVAAFLNAFRRQFRHVELVVRDLSHTAAAPVLLSGEIDAALVGAGVEPEPRFRYTPLYTERMALACDADHPLAGHAGVSLNEVLRHGYVDRLECEFRDTFLAEAARRSFAPMFVARTDREEWAQMMIARGVGVSLVPEFSMVVPNIVLVPLSDPPMERVVSLAVPRGREDTRTVNDFLGAMRRHRFVADPQPRPGPSVV